VSKESGLTIRGQTLLNALRIKKTGVIEERRPSKFTKQKQGVIEGRSHSKVKIKSPSPIDYKKKGQGDEVTETYPFCIGL
jgi:hypothetical protein